MIEFNRLFELYMAKEGTGEMYDLVDMQQMGITKKDFVSPPKKVPFVKMPQPDTVKCPKCGYKFHCKDSG